MKKNKTNLKSPKIILPIVIVIVFAAVGAMLITRSHAASFYSAAVLTSDNAVIAPGISVGGLTAGSMDFVKGPQVIYVSPGAKLKFNQGVKGNVTHCYLVQVLPDKSGTGSAQAYFASNNNSVGRLLTYNPTNPNAFQQVCIGPGYLPNPGWSVANASTTQGIVVYQDVVTY